MLEPIRATLANISQQYHDTRTQRCQIEALSMERGCCLLSGNVLDQATLDSVTAELANHFPRLTFDTSNILILRQPSPTHMVVTTSVTGLHDTTTFRSEMKDQLLTGSVVELLTVEGAWAFVRLADGYLGWVYKRYLDEAAPSESTHYISQPVSKLRLAPKEDAPILNRLLVGTAVCVMEMVNGYQRITAAGNVDGWVPADNLRPQEALPNQPAKQRAQMVQDSVRFIGIPYNWGGITAYGFDCSGYVRMLHKLSGIHIPRDADMQFMAGKPVEPPFQPGDLLFFGSASSHRSISHVGMSTGGWKIIHASRANNGVFEDDVEKTGWLNDIYVGARTFVL
jgi:cell wall-associated NlpC family hydrolase